MIFETILIIALFFLSFLLTGCARWWSIKIGCMDLPSERSAHIMPTPRGGGIAFVICFISALLVLMQWQLISVNLARGLMSIGITVALLGYSDDQYHLSAGVRLLMQFLFVSLALYLLHFFEAGYPLLFNSVALLFGVWLINLFNFMDGIDGFAAMEAMFIAVSLAIFQDLPLSLVMLCLSVSVLGFMFWNFPYAKIFMGDVGSSFLGGIFAVSFIFLYQQQACAFWGAMILIALFFVDSSLTLAKRLWRLEPVWKAHKQHAYQRLAEKLQSHAPVTLLGLAVNVFWLFPWSYLTTFQVVPIWLGVGMAYGGVVVGISLKCEFKG